MNLEAAKSGIGEDIRWVFASFLFAYLIADIAGKFAKLVRHWDSVGKKKWPALTHLLLALVVVVTSWIGWSVATMQGSYPHVADVFGLPTVPLLLDIALLIAYFTLILGIDVEPSPVTSAAGQKSAICVVILVGYLFWDIVTMVWIPYPNSRFGSSGGISAVSALLAFIAYRLFKNIPTQRPVLSAWADGSLIFLFLWYRAAKQYAYEVSPLPSEQVPPTHSLTAHSVGVLAVVLLSAFVAVTAGVHYQARRKHH